jgi:hypothetical protein
MNLQATLKKQEKTLATYNNMYSFILACILQTPHNFKTHKLHPKKKNDSILQGRSSESKEEMTHNPKKKHNSRSCK